MKFTVTHPVTIYHYDEKEKRDFSFHFPKAKVHGITKTGNLNHMKRFENKYVVRIMTEDDVVAECGDEIFCDVFGRLTIVGISDNRRGSKRVKHFRLEVK